MTDQTQEDQNTPIPGDDPNPAPSGEPAPAGDETPPEGQQAAGDEGDNPPDPNAQKPEGDRKKRRRNRTEKHIANLTRRAEEAERRAAYLQGQVDATQQSKPNEPERPIRADFDDEEDYIDAVADFKVAQRSNDKGQPPQQQVPPPPAAVNEPEEIRNFREKGLETYGDEFAQAMADQTIPISQAMGQTMMELENGHDIMMFLSDNKTEARKLFNMSPRAQLRELEKINEQVGDYSQSDDSGNTQQANNGQPSPQPRQSSAPPPPNHEKGGDSAPVTSLDKAKNMDDYARLWKADRVAKRTH